MNKTDDKWTKQQRYAIETTESDLIVSASAGSGKTSAMVQRALSLIVDKNVPVDKIMLLTFTNNSAGEMKERLRQGMIDYAKTHPEKVELLREQLDNINQADVSTIHGFCFKLAREFFEVVGLSPSIEISSDDETETNRAKAMQKTLARCEQDEQISELMRKLSLRKDDLMVNMISSLYDYMTAQPDRKSWLKDCISVYDRDFEHGKVSTFIAEYYSSVAEAYCDKLRSFIGYARENNLLKSLEYGLAVLDNVQRFERLKTLKDLYLAYTQPVIKYTKPRAKDDVYLIESITEIRDEFTKSYLNEIDKLMNLGRTYDEIERYNKKAGEQIKELVKAVTIFEEEYDKIKAEQNVIDFADMERYAEEILSDEVIANEVRDRHDYVFVDEFQDTNYVQYSIIKKVTKPDRLFVVGDVKQCIYRFRLAEPTIFLDTLSEWKAQDKAVFFMDNFRSDNNVLNFVNHVFDYLMVKRFGGIDYKEDGRFKIRENSYEQEVPSVTILRSAVNAPSKNNVEIIKDENGVYDISNDELYDNAVDEIEAGLIYNYVQSVLGKTIYVKGVSKKVEYKDICIMYNARSASKNTLNTLSEAGIPLNIGDFEENFAQKELDIFMDFISVVDNCYDDYPFIASLHSFIGGVSNRELAEIRLNSPYARYFYDACKDYVAKKDDKLSDKLKNFFADLDRFRFLATYTEISEFLQIVCEETGYRTYLTSLENGEKIFSLINSFIDKIKGKKYAFDLHGLLDYYKENSDIQLKSFVSVKDGIRVCTTHSSKGLEFPVVILAGLSHVASPSSATINTDRELGVGMKYYDKQNSEIIDTVTRQIIDVKKKKDATEDKLRLAYVAMTRAQSALALIMPENSKSKVFPFTSNRLSDWIECCIDADDFVRSKVVYQTPHTFDKSEQTERVTPVEKEIDRNVSNVLEYRYPYANATVTARKYSVSALNSDDDKVELRFVDSDENSFSGTAHHRVMQYIDLQTMTYDGVRKEIDRMLSQNLLDVEEYNTIDVDEIVKCLNSPIMDIARESEVYRERKFVLSKTADDVLGNGCDEKVLVQGVIDMLIVGEQIIVLDFKRSRLSEQKLIEKYSTQLKLYADAVEKSFGRYPDKLLLYVFGKDKEIEIK